MAGLFDNAGPLRPLYEDIDWSTTPLGPVDGWSPTLKSTVSLALNTKFAVTLMWGDDFTMVYNSAYAEMIGAKHPNALGKKLEDVFAEAWTTLEPLVLGVRDGGNAVWQEDMPLLMERNGIMEETSFTFSYSPVPNEDGEVEGVLDIAAETTQQVVNLRRLSVLTQIAVLSNELESSSLLPARAKELIRANVPEIADLELFISGDVESSRFGVAPESLEDDDVVMVEADGSRIAWIRLPGNELQERPLLAVKLSNNLVFDAAYRSFISLMGSGLGQAWTRSVLHEQEEEKTRVAVGMAEALQRSLLQDPTQPDHIQIAVRYVPARETAQVGGDWYDSFTNSEGRTSFVIGDVAGHDQKAAASMGQLKNVLRGIGYTVSDSPSAVLSALDHAIRDLAIGGLATVVLATLEQDDEAKKDQRLLRWSNAGHPPILAINPSGKAEFLEEEANLLLGVQVNAPRVDHSRVIEADTTLLMYTDGLIERRGRPMSAGYTQLADAAERFVGLDLEDFCDQLLGEISAGSEDDVAVIAIRLHSGLVDRPPEAGPELSGVDMRQENLLA